MKEKKREFLAVRFEIDLPLKRDQLTETIRLLDGLLQIFRQAAVPPPPPEQKEP